ncbi:MAG: acyl-ACP--UDP-N-acetylglucosamine O-acyltransferase [Candidatus Polarisedimenticolaceae bacterium]|nr:acyl-ACP--UDP-N-acetylglucosamine O-acyltransferase [Candidatus Polarisedimenticolaceae bacterium]
MINKHAIIDPTAELDEGVTIGPFSVIGAGVKIGKGSEIRSHVVINGPTTIGCDNKIYQFASVGEDPQDKKFAGEETRLEIGDRNVIREFTTISRGTVQDEGYTRIGSDNLLMAYTHVAHDCIIGNHVILANAASLGGHVTIGDHAILGGFTIVHQFCQIGMHSFCGMGSAISKDVVPYITVTGNPASARSINAEGLSRRGFDKDAIRRLKRAYKLIFMSKIPLSEAKIELEKMAKDGSEIQVIIGFLQRSERSIVR